MWLLAGPIKHNWPSVTLWLVFQYPVTNKAKLAKLLSIVICNVVREIKIAKLIHKYIYLHTPVTFVAVLLTDDKFEVTSAKQ